MQRGAKPTKEAQRAAAKMLARGERPSVVAATVQVNPKTLRRWRATEAFQHMIEVERRHDEAVRHATAKRHALTHGLPEPTHPREARAEQALHRQTLEELRSEQAAKARSANGYSDGAVQAWILYQAPVECEEDRLDWNEARRGVIGNRARRRYATRNAPRRKPSFRIIGIDTPASLMYSESIANASNVARDVFAGHYDGLGVEGGGRYALRTVFAPASEDVA